MNILITGGAGFIGCNAADRFMQDGFEVTVADNLSRKGSETNLRWLQARGPARFVQTDVRHHGQVTEALRASRADVILHLAAQTAVTLSVQDPREDFEINALGTFNVLEAARRSDRDPIVIYASTNKVYGGMEGVPVVERETRHAYRDLPGGVDESAVLDFHSPYGCSKGAGDQYVRDYHRVYGLRTVVFRQSCIYGPRQFGVEDQGWVAWFLIAALYGKPITIYGDGKQVRDLLYIDDLIRAYRRSIDRIDVAAGRVYNLGGGPGNSLSIWREFGGVLANLAGHPVNADRANWRPGDQRIFIADVSRARSDLGWEPSVGVPEGLARLSEWMRGNGSLLREVGVV